MTNLLPAQIKSIEARLLNIAKGHGRSPMDQRILFLLERTLARLVLDPDLHKGLIFKGGFVGMRVYGSERFTTDIDAALSGISSERAIEKIKRAMLGDLADGAWFHFERQEETDAQGDYGGLSLKFRGGLGEPPSKIEKALRIGIDIGIGDPVTPSPIQKQIPQSIGEGTISWSVYPVETMIAEKLHALLFLGSRNSRSKDIYDMNLFWNKADPLALRQAIERTFAYREFPVPQSISEAISKIDMTILKRGWASAIASVSETVDFDEILASLIQKAMKI
ncbi:nucleotidyl transferase AbiEii/AbiGii toxin family protein [Oligoflexus tunisiensis]|uniref:nucleotidyl transferase AbiEii/AbiGii toxin family protein n=1 Tax=Oligoflexus tunisiensis TaxID=708132 RepID=UPI00114CF74C|nr:nucleotidyl transferase AbiEii/AbiGii toxin family protein [Oligoflexus tunisiensis]